MRSHLRYKHAAEGHRGTEADTEAHGDYFVVGAKVDWYKRQPYNTGGVHGECNVLGLVKICRNIASLRKEKERKTSIFYVLYPRRKKVSHLRWGEKCSR